MKKVLTLLTCLLPIFLFSQTVTVSEEVSIRNDKAYDIIGKMKDRVLLYRQRASKVEIQCFDKNLRQTWNKELDFDHKKYKIIGLIPDKENFSVVYFYKRKGVDYLKLQKYDPAANMIDSTTIAKYPHKFNSPTPDLIYSENKKKVLIYSIKNQKEITAFAFDLVQMRTLWTSKFKLEDLNFYSTGRMEILLTNTADMYLTVSRDNRKSKKENHRYEIYRAGVGIQNVERLIIPMEDRLTYHMKFEYDNVNRRLIGAGLFSDNQKQRSNGFFVIYAPASNLKNYKLHFTPFEEEFLSELEGKPINLKKGLENTSVQDVVLRKDGGVLLFCERTKEYERRMASAGRGFVGDDGLRYIVDYYYDNLFLISIHPDGTNHWKTILHKKQYSQDDGAIFSSYFLLKTPSRLRVLFNDEIRFDNTVSEYIVRGNGDHERNSVMSTEDQDIHLRFRDALQVGSKEVIVPSERRNRLRLVRVTF